MSIGNDLKAQGGSLSEEYVQYEIEQQTVSVKWSIKRYSTLLLLCSEKEMWMNFS